MSTHPQIPEEVAALISAYALGALEPDQAALAEEHIAASDDCRRAYEDALEKCSTKHAPWYIVPADHKWFRNWVVSDTIVRTLAKMDLEYPKAIEGIEKYTIK